MPVTVYLSILECGLSAFSIVQFAPHRQARTHILVRNSMQNVFKITADEEVDGLIAQLSAHGLAHRIELVRAVRRRHINLIEPQRSAEVPKALLEASMRPTVALLGDDDYASTGPTGWTCFRRLGYWAKAALVHATGADIASYRAAVGMAMASDRFLLIETNSAFAHEWARALHKRNIQTIGLLPPDGQHPIPLSKDQLQ